MDAVASQRTRTDALVTPLRRAPAAAIAAPVSVLILTYNEERNIGACLDSVAWCDDVVVLDSFSNDRTIELAASKGVRVFERAFDNYAAQRNFGLQEIRYRHKWVLMLDADERVTDELHAELRHTFEAPAPGVSLYLLRRRDHLFGRWLKRSSGYPTWFGRLARVGEVWVERPINEEYCTTGRTARLQGHLDHYPFNKGLSAWIAKHDRYSTMEAELMLEGGLDQVRYADALLRDPLRRRKALKRIAYSMPGRPLLMFLALYLVKGGLLDGAAGFTFSALRAWYEYMIDCKRVELERRQRGLPV